MIFPCKSPQSRRLRWLMVVVILIDLSVTILGQPPSYWRDPGTAVEGNDLYRHVVVLGCAPLILAGLIYCAVLTAIASILPRFWSQAMLFSFLLGHFFGGSTWICFHFNGGMASIVIYGIVVSLGIAWSLADSSPDHGP